MDIHQLFLVAATAAGISLAAVLFYAISRQGTLNSIKSRTVGDGQHGTARWATKPEIAQSYDHVAFTPSLWRKEGYCWPAVSTMSRELSLSRSTIQRALRELEHTGWLTREPRWRENGSSSSNRYHVLTP